MGKWNSYIVFTLKWIINGAKIKMSKYNKLLGKKINVFESDSWWELSKTDKKQKSQRINLDKSWLLNSLKLTVLQKL